MRVIAASSLLIVFALAAGCEAAPERPASPDATPAAVAPAASPQSPAPGSPGAPAAETAASVPATPSAPAAAAAPVVVDVRTPQEYAAGHVQGAISLPLEALEQRWEELEAYRDQPVVLYCRSGRRSGLALESLKAKGFTQLENGGGMDAMAAKGYTVTK